MTTPATPDVVERKVTVAALVTLVASVLYAVLDAVAEQPAVLDLLPAWGRFVVLAVIPPVLVFLAGYRTPSNRVG